MTSTDTTDTAHDETSRADEIHVTRRRALRAGAIGTVMATTGMTALASPASAATAPNPDGVLADGFSGADFWAFLTGLGERYSPPITAAPESQTLSDRIRNEFGNNTDAWVDYGNWLLDEQDVEPIGTAEIAVTVEITRLRSVTSPGRTTTSLVVEYDDFDDRFVDLDWTDTEPEAPDYEITVRNRAAERAADELQTFRRRYIGPQGDHQLPATEYISTLAGRYNDAVLIGEQSAHVLGLLLGDFQYKHSLEVN
jgi:hypothetical protein